MRIPLLLLAAIPLLVLMPSAGRAANCPANANAASFAVWPPNGIPTGKEVTGTHPCGRRIACTGGVPNQGRTRLCRWL